MGHIPLFPRSLNPTQEAVFIKEMLLAALRHADSSGRINYQVLVRLDDRRKAQTSFMDTELKGLQYHAEKFHGYWLSRYVTK